MKKNPNRIIAVFLSLMMLTAGITIPSESALSSFFKHAADYYYKGDYEASIWHLNTCLELIQPENAVLKTKIFLMTAAGYMNLGNEKKASLALQLLRDLIEKEELGGIPYIKNIKPYKISGYNRIFKDSKYKVKRVIEKQRKNKKKKRSLLPILIVGAAIAAITAAIIIFRKRDKDPDEEPYRDIEWVAIPAGEFEMGDDKGIGEEDEHPLHTVYLDEYYISKYEVTFEQFDKFCDETERLKPSSEISNVYFVRRGKFPVMNISRDDADAYCNWLSLKIGRDVHLPTEAQWEKAARGTDKRTYPWGDQEPTLYLANWGARSYGAVPKVVGSHPDGVSPYGIHDMAGNVWEFCSDWYDAGYYSVSPYKNPQGPANGTIKVKRGGSYMYPDGTIRSSARGSRFNIEKGPTIGFRPVME